MSLIRNTVDAITGGMNIPPMDAESSTAPANSGRKPTRFIIGMVKEPLVATLAIWLPEMVPNSPLPTTATLAGPPRARPAHGVGQVHEERSAAQMEQQLAEEHEQDDVGRRDVHQRAPHALGTQKQHVDDPVEGHARVPPDPAEEISPEHVREEDHGDEHERHPRHPPHSLEHQQDQQGAEDQVPERRFVDEAQPQRDALQVEHHVHPDGDGQGRQGPVPPTNPRLLGSGSVVDEGERQEPQQVCRPVLKHVQLADADDEHVEVVERVQDGEAGDQLRGEAGELPAATLGVLLVHLAQGGQEGHGLVTLGQVWQVTRQGYAA